MNVWNKVLYVLIAVLCVGFTVLAANKYSLSKKWDAKLKAQVETLEALQAEIDDSKIAIDGDPLRKAKNDEKKAETWADLGLRAQLDRVRSLLRGDAFVNCQPLEAKEIEIRKDPFTQAPILGVELEFAIPASHTLAAFDNEGNALSSFRANAIAYVFDSGKEYYADSDDVDVDDEQTAEEDAQPGRYLGAFQFVGASATQATLVSLDNLTEQELAAIQESKNSGHSWIVCVDRLPMDAPADVLGLIQANADKAKDAENSDAGDEALTQLAQNEAVKSIFETANLAAQVFPELAQAADPTTAVDYQYLLARQFAARDAENFRKVRNEIALADLSKVVVNQRVAIGDKGDEAMQALYAAEDYEAAVQAKRVASYAEKKATLDAALAKMKGYCELAKEKLNEAKTRVADCQAAVDATLAENVRLAAEIAQAQIALAENAEQKSENGGETTTAFALSGV